MSQNITQVGVAFAAAALQAYVSVPITYTSGSYSASFNATPGSSKLRVSDPSGTTRIVRTDADFIFPAALLVLNGDTVEPFRNDVITRLWPDGETRRYKVVSPGGDEPHFRYSDQERTLIRVHCKYSGEVP